MKPNKQQQTLIAKLAKKLHPRKLNVSPQFGFIIGAILGQAWVTGPRGERSESAHFSITSDGFLLSGGMFIGSMEDCEENMRRIVAPLLNDQEKELFNALYLGRFTDWRHNKKLAIV